MSVAAFVAAIHKRADALRNTARLLRASGNTIAKEVKRNIDRRQNAGEYRVEDAGTVPGEPMQPLAKYTIQDRERRGVYHDHQLKDSGATYRSIGVRNVTPTKAVVGSKTGRGRRLLRKQLGTTFTGIESSDTRSVIPPRNPMGYSARIRRMVLRQWVDAFALRDKSSARIDIRA